MPTDIKATWETYTARSVFLMSDFLRIGVDLDDEDCAKIYGAGTKADGRSLSWRSVTVKSVVASLLLVDLGSILEDALDVVLAGKPAPSEKGWRRDLFGKLRWAREVGILPSFEFERLDAVRDERNRVAHDRYTMDGMKLREHEHFVRKQLDAWALIPDVPMFRATLDIHDWEDQAKHWKREIWAGVESSSRTRAWGFTVTDVKARQYGSRPARQG